MSRKARNAFLYDGCYSHIISRSIRKLKVFRSSEDFEIFLILINDFKTSTNSFKIFHYCLMHTHFHLVLQIVSVSEFAKCLNQIKSRYVMAFHTKYRLSGPIWRERYKSLLIEDEKYMKACGQYVEHNPVEAGLVSLARDWKYSSAKHYQGDIKDKIIDEYSASDLIEGIDVSNKKEFERGNSIGSEVYKFKVRRGLI